MAEIRHIRRDEADDFLRILCDIFSLDPSRAAGIFYSEPYFDVQRKHALFVEGKMVSILTTTPMQFGWGRAIGIAGVGTRPEWRGQGLAEQLLRQVLVQADAEGEGAAMLFAHQETVYERVGFQAVDSVVRANLDLKGSPDPPEPLSFGQVEQAYSNWAGKDRARLVRDQRRWTYWRIIYRECLPIGTGYAAMEGNLCREYVPGISLTTWPCAGKTEWYGMASLTKTLELPVSGAKDELIVMTRNFPLHPQMFMTDQF